jgi:pyruvate,water dikinase
MLARAENGGNEWQNMPTEQGEQSVLNDGQIMELTDLILKIEDHYKSPQDIEWAFEKGTFCITQSRPITTLS